MNKKLAEVLKENEDLKRQVRNYNELDQLATNLVNEIKKNEIQLWEDSLDTTIETIVWERQKIKFADDDPKYDKEDGYKTVSYSGIREQFEKLEEFLLPF